jgi:hypothetical protein
LAIDLVSHTRAVHHGCRGYQPPVMSPADSRTPTLVLILSTRIRTWSAFQVAYTSIDMENEGHKFPKSSEPYQVDFMALLTIHTSFQTMKRKKLDLIYYISVSGDSWEEMSSFRLASALLKLVCKAPLILIVKPNQSTLARDQVHG